ncbi:hypothetical protein PHLGIDRAFT_17135 [Phlebiopsis gigantea 11061_1 CR5-6]|uniref:CBM1 domain-containing protein n=1 Tax=Phlebiopsis gigantea (strain 11061_1 CR5-6) TaxID=745531 RepID=A0A0C3P9W4_PHLG1|nr:hypothetical protein PHLGIDRAFT_17135 [Phlebiopsis gigantea 11061_1 CR5-6]
MPSFPKILCITALAALSCTCAASPSLNVGDKKVQMDTISCNDTPAPEKRSSVQAAWGQCGGFEFSEKSVIHSIAGPTVCATGSVCTFFNTYYSQCMASASPTPVTSSAKPPPPPPTSVASSSSSAPASTPSSSANACSQVFMTPSDGPRPLGTDTCGHIGDLPPISEDCQTIVDSITIMNGSISSTFNVAPNTIEQLTFGTCRFWFQNNSNATLTECWTALAQAASVAESACFPPVQPVQSVGLCTPADASWQIGELELELPEFSYMEALEFTARVPRPMGLRAACRAFLAY